MARSYTNQAMTRDPNALVIGVMRVRVEKLTGANDIDQRQAPVDWDSAEGTGSSRNLGALRSSSLSVTPTTKTHTSGYPMQQDLIIQEQVTATYRVDMEEIAGSKCFEMIDAVLNTINTGAPAYFAVEALAEFSTGSRAAFFTPYAYLRPNLSLNFGQDFNVNSFEFEALFNSLYTNQNLVYRKFVPSTAGRDRQYQAVTQNAGSLQIGFFQVRVGRHSPRPAWTTTVNNPIRMTKLSDASLAIGGTNNYVGSKRGNYTVEYVTDTIVVTDPYGNTLTPLAKDNTEQTIENGLKVQFTNSANLVSGDKWSIYVDGASYVGPAIQQVGTEATRTITTSGTWAGANDGSIVITVLAGGATFSWTHPTTGVVTTGVAMSGFTAAPTQLGTTGVYIQLSAATGWTEGNVFSIALNTSAAITTATQTNNISPYPTTTPYDSIGSVQNTALNASATMKEHFSGYPAKKDLALLESTDVAVEVTMEEMKIEPNTDYITPGQAKTLFDAMFDANMSSTQYYAPVELVGELATGGTPLRFWLANTQIVPNIEMAPGQDFAGIPFRLQGLKQLGLNVPVQPKIVARL